MWSRNKIHLDAVSQVDVGMTHSDFVKEAVKRLPAAQEEFGDLYNTQMLEMKIGRAVMSSYKAVPRKVRQYCRMCDEMMGKGSGTRK